MLGIAMTDRFLSFLEFIYGVLFTPETALRQLRTQPFPAGGAIIVLLVNLLEALRLQRQDTAISGQVTAGILGWIFLSVLLERLCAALQKEVSLEVILTLSGFASLPWLFIAPALCFGGTISTILGLTVLGWFTYLQVWATAIALNISPGQAFSLLPLALVGGMTSIVLLVAGIKSLITIS